jgi:UDP-N-acetylglucosamine 2-epimerase (non-hydrolysing)/GDP/UDP-N,N'-diacetylbacillosamine 2-epimerase (hydrolysing)
MSDNDSPVRREVLVLTGTRAEYGLLKSSMNAIRGHGDLSLSVVATGMHLSPRHGSTVEEIRADGFTVDREVVTQLDGDTGTAMAKSLGVGTMGLADTFEALDPDLLLVLGDRGEALAGTLAAAHMAIPVAHVHGGDAMHGATIDDSIRHAITKFAHLHFPASARSADRIRKLGEEGWRITTVGAPGLDDVLAGAYDDPATVRERYDLDPDRPLVLVLQHPITMQPTQAGEQMAATLDAVTSVDTQAVVVYPNADAGGDRMIEEIQSRQFGEDVWTVRNLPRDAYLGMMATADVMVGNSSSGIIEAPSFGLPVVDVGPRQEGRERTDNVLSVPHETAAIREAIERCLADEAVRERAAACENPYDYGGAGERIVERLTTVDLGENLLRKQLTY